MRERESQFVHGNETGTASLSLCSRNISKIQTQSLEIVTLASAANHSQPSLSVSDPGSYGVRGEDELFQQHWSCSLIKILLIGCRSSEHISEQSVEHVQLPAQLSSAPNQGCDFTIMACLQLTALLFASLPSSKKKSITLKTDKSWEWAQWEAGIGVCHEVIESWLHPSADGSFPLAWICCSAVFIERLCDRGTHSWCLHLCSAVDFGRINLPHQ